MNGGPLFAPAVGTGRPNGSSGVDRHDPEPPLIRAFADAPHRTGTASIGDALSSGPAADARKGERPNRAHRRWVWCPVREPRRTEAHSVLHHGCEMRRCGRDDVVVC